MNGDTSAETISRLVQDSIDQYGHEHTHDFACRTWRGRNWAGACDCSLPRRSSGGDVMTAALPPYSRKPITLPDGTPVIGWSGPATPTRPQRCACGRPVPASSSCGCHCAEHDHPYPTTARFDERYDPSPEPIDRSIK